MTQSNSIGFVIWGVRNGFEVMAASDSTHALKEVVNDNMRQVCNSAPERLYTVHHTDRFSAVSIYHTDAKDVVGRRAYIAITLYVSKGLHFMGDVAGTLNRLMDFYIHKQGNAKVNMFTEDMVREQFAGLGAQAMPNNSKPVGKKLGIWRYQQIAEIGHYLSQLNTDGYRAVFFLSPANAASEKQLMGYEVISSFVRPVVLTLLGYSAAGYNIYHNNRQLPPSQQDEYEVEGMPGDLVRVSKTGTGREKTMQLMNASQEYRLSALFPSSGGSGGSGGARSGPDEPKLSWKKIALFLTIFAAIIGIAVYFTLGSGEGEKEGGVTMNPSDTATVNAHKDSGNIKNNSSAVVNSGTSAVVTDTIKLSIKLNNAQRTQLKNKINIGKDIKIDFLKNPDSLMITYSLEIGKVEALNKIENTIKDIQKPSEVITPTPGKGNAPTTTPADPCKKLCDEYKKLKIESLKKTSLQEAMKHGCDCN